MSENSAFNRLSSLLRTVSTTGTNGKTTTTSMIASIVDASGEVSVKMTTLGAWIQGARVSEDLSMSSFLSAAARAVEAGARTLALETTSTALARGFASRWPAQVAIFTNLSRDHLDEHGTPEHYLAAKAQLFMSLLPKGVAVLNADDPASELLAQVLPSHLSGVRYFGRGATEGVDGLFAERVELGHEGLSITLRRGPLAERLGGALVVPMYGEVHAYNALAAACAADALGYSASSIREGLRAFEGVPGRFQVVSRGPLVVVDYAHTPDALEGTLGSARSLAAAASGRLLCVFGCGGERDQGKRALMGSVADGLADVVVLTTDNPRSEPPARIAKMVREGARGGAKWIEVPDRAAAIRAAITQAAPHDVVVIAGKGHEQNQIFKDHTIVFSDVDVALDARRE